MRMPTIFTCAVFAFLLAGCAEDSAEEAPEQDALTVEPIRSPSEAPNEPDSEPLVPDTKLTDWEVTRSEDIMGRTDGVHVTTDSVAGDEAQIAFTCNSAGGFVFVAVFRYVGGEDYDVRPVAYRIDDEPAVGSKEANQQGLEFRLMPGGRSLALIEGARRFADVLMDAERLGLQVRRYDMTTSTSAFDVAGLGDALDELPCFGEEIE